MNDVKKKLEAIHLKNFLALRPELVIGEAVPGEEPDFTVSRPAGSLGIELTQLLQESPPEESPIQAQESLRARVLALARELYKTSDPLVVVSILFNPAYPLAKSRVQWLAEAVIEIVLRNMPPTGAYSEERYNWLNRSYFPREFDRVAVYRGLGFTQSSWSAPGSTWLQTFGCEEFQAVLDKKAHRCPAYRDRCEELWLLIVADGQRLASTIAIEEQIVGHEFRSEFDRIFLLHNLRKVYELAVAPRTTLRPIDY